MQQLKPYKSLFSEMALHYSTTSTSEISISEIVSLLEKYIDEELSLAAEHQKIDPSLKFYLTPSGKDEEEQVKDDATLVNLIDILNSNKKIIIESIQDKLQKLYIESGWKSAHIDIGLRARHPRGRSIVQVIAKFTH